MEGTVFAGLLAGFYRVLLVDPAWWFRTYSTLGWQKSAHSKYGCMSLEQILSLPIAQLCAPDCALVLWSTQVHLAQALQVMGAWGFRLSSSGAWAKQSRTGRCWQFGTGYVLRSAAEPFLVGMRGHPAQLSRRERNLIVAPVREHSRKPDEMYEMCERLWPGPYCELFVRYRRPGWHQWNNGEVLT